MAKQNEDYKWIATSPKGFVQQVVTNYVGKGYWYFVRGRIPDGKDPLTIDEKLLTLYDIRKTPQQRYRSKRRGEANLHYIRYEREWLLVGTKGKHKWWERERENIKDARKVPIHFEGYSISLKAGRYRPQRHKENRAGPPEADFKRRVRVLIGREAYRDLRAEFLGIAGRRESGLLGALFYTAPYEPYGPVRQQLLAIHRQVNKRRKWAGLSSISTKCIRLRHKPVKPFEPQR